MMKRYSQMDVGKGGRQTDPFMSNPNMTMQAPRPCIEIVEQPRARGLRFRYKCEGRSAGTIPGDHSTNENRTYPTIRISNYSGPSAIVVVSCVTKDEGQPRPHPHALVGKDCKEGVCTVKLKGTNQISFPSLGIQCATKKEVQDALKQREKIRVDPWGRGYYDNVNNIDLGQVRLAFQAFLPDDNGKYTRIVAPVYSHIIYDKKSVSDLVICRLSRQSGSVDGGDEIFLLCEKVNKEDIQIRFFLENKFEGLVWEAFGGFGPQDVHRQVAIVFKTPQFRDRNITTPTEVFIQLRRPSDDEVSDPKPFQYIPLDPDPDNVFKKRKRKTVDFKSFLQDVPFTPQGPPYASATKDALKQKLMAKRVKPSPSSGDMSAESSTDGYMFMDTHNAHFSNQSSYPTPSNEPGNPWGHAQQQPQHQHQHQQSPPLNIPFTQSVSVASASQQGGTAGAMDPPAAVYTSLTAHNQQPLKQEGGGKINLTHESAAAAAAAQIGEFPKLLSLSNYLGEGYDGAISLPSLPSIGEEFPNKMQVVIGQDVAAEETVVASATDSPSADNHQASQSPSNDNTQPRNHSTTANSRAAESLDRRIGDAVDHLNQLK